MEDVLIGAAWTLLCVLVGFLIGAVFFWAKGGFYGPDEDDEVFGPIYPDVSPDVKYLPRSELDSSAWDDWGNMPDEAKQFTGGSR